MKKTLVVCVSILLLAGCSSPDGEQSVAEAPTETPVQTPVDTAAEAPAETLSLPEGYPQIVPVSEIPENMQWAFEGTGTSEAVAVAPGVWAELTPGATVDDAVNAQVFHGHCSSKKAFEREYLHGESTPGNCW